ncbi:MAG TPA: DHA2 family efflux MFS transporter permease subunit [Polyangiaceae bacterium]|jgi:DHA2 family multidrug resistance protein|nr:DHA2 family efflux MFS transporter permease subunit [Polyangiaceae bacterium]
MSASAGTANAVAPKPPEYFATGWTGGRNPWAIALVVTMATFMEVLDTSIANVSLPHIAGNLSVSQDESTWILTSYLVSNAVVLPISGWLSTRIGRKRFYMSCVALFTISSFLCGIAPSLGSLIFFRILQGIGGGGLGPSEQAILADTFPPAKRGMAMAVYGMAVVLAPAIGPTLGGFITDNFSWRWVFFINIPVGIASLMLSRVFVSDPPHLKYAREHASRSVDWTGLALIATGLGCLEYVLDKGQEDDWFHSSAIVGFSTVAATCLVSFVVWELNHENPIVDLKMFRRRSFAVANALMLTLGIALFGSTVLLPQYMQILMGYTAQQSGMALSPGGFVVISLLPLVGRLVGKVDTRALITIGFVSLSLSLFYMAHTIDLGMDFGTATELRAIQMAGLAFLFVPIQTVSYAGVEPQKFNQVSGIMNLSRNLGGDIGIAAVTTLITRRAQSHQATLTQHTTLYDPAYTAKLAALTRVFEGAGAATVDAAKQATAALYRQVILQATQLAYLDALIALGVTTALMVPLVWVANRPTPQGAPMGH